MADAVLYAFRDSKLQLIPVPTPRWPDLLCVYHRTDRLLFTSNIFSAHVAPSVVNTSGESAKDVGGWDMYGQDWRHYFDCMLAPVAKQAAGAVHALQHCCCAWPSTLLLSVVYLWLTMPVQIESCGHWMQCLNSLSGLKTKAVKTLQQGFQFCSHVQS